MARDGVQEPPEQSNADSSDEGNSANNSLNGAHVVINELLQRPSLNGCVGTAGDFDEAKQRVKVHVIEDGMCHVLLLRPACISRASDEQAAADAAATRQCMDSEVDKLQDASSADPDAERAIITTIGDLAEKVSVAENHACEAGSALLTTKTRSISAMLATLRSPSVSAATEWRALRALRFLVRGDMLAIAAACGRGLPKSSDAAAEEPGELTLPSGPQLGTAALRSATTFLQKHASGAFIGAQEPPSSAAAAAEAERSKLRWAADMLKALSWDDEGARACHQADAAKALAGAMLVGARWVEVQLACVVALRNLVAHLPALRMLAEERNTAGSDQMTIRRVVAALNLFPTHTELASYGCELLALVALNGLCPCCGGACGDASDVRVELNLSTIRGDGHGGSGDRNARTSSSGGDDRSGTGDDGDDSSGGSGGGGADSVSSSSGGGGGADGVSSSSGGGDGMRVVAGLEVLSISGGAAAGREAVLSAWGLEAVARVISRCDDKYVYRDALRAMMALASGEQAAKVLRAGGLETTLAAMRKFPDDQECTTLGLTTLRELAIDNARQMRSTEVVDAAKFALERFPDVEDIACRALGLLTNLANDPEPLLAMPRRQLCRHGVPKLLVESLARFDRLSTATCPALMALAHMANSMNGDISQALIDAGALPAVLSKLDELCANSTDSRSEPDDRSDEPSFYALGTIVGLSEGARAADCWAAGAHLSALQCLDAFSVDADSCGAALRALLSMVRACELKNGGRSRGARGHRGGQARSSRRAVDVPSGAAATGGGDEMGGDGGGALPDDESEEEEEEEEDDDDDDDHVRLGAPFGHMMHRLPKQASSIPMPNRRTVPWRRIAAPAVRVLNECVSEDICDRQTEEVTCLLASLASAGAAAQAALIAEGAPAAAARAVHKFPKDLGVVRNSWRALSRLATLGTNEQRLEVRRAAYEAKVTQETNGHRQSPQTPPGTGTDSSHSSPGSSTEDDEEASRQPITTAAAARDDDASVSPLPRPQLGTLECAICFSASAALGEGAFVKFECGHAFCEACVALHVQARLAGKERHCRCAQCSEAAHPECPLCRRPLGPTGILAAALHVPTQLSDDECDECDAS